MDTLVQFDEKFAPRVLHSSWDGRFPSRASPVVGILGLDDKLQPGAGLASAYWDDAAVHPIASRMRISGSASWPPQWLSLHGGVAELLQNTTRLEALVSGISARVGDVLQKYLQLDGRPLPGSSQLGIALDVARVYTAHATAFGVSLE